MTNKELSVKFCKYYSLNVKEEKELPDGLLDPVLPFIIATTAHIYFLENIAGRKDFKKGMKFYRNKWREEYEAFMKVFYNAVDPDGIDKVADKVEHIASSLKKHLMIVKIANTNALLTDDRLTQDDRALIANAYMANMLIRIAYDMWEIVFKKINIGLGMTHLHNELYNIVQFAIAVMNNRGVKELALEKKIVDNITLSIQVLVNKISEWVNTETFSAA